MSTKAKKDFPPHLFLKHHLPYWGTPSRGKRLGTMETTTPRIFLRLCFLTGKTVAAFVVNFSSKFLSTCSSRKDAFILPCHYSSKKFRHRSCFPLRKQVPAFWSGNLLATKKSCDFFVPFVGEYGSCLLKIGIFCYMATPRGRTRCCASHRLAHFSYCDLLRLVSRGNGLISPCHVSRPAHLRSLALRGVVNVGDPSDRSGEVMSEKSGEAISKVGLEDGDQSAMEMSLSLTLRSVRRNMMTIEIDARSNIHLCSSSQSFQHRSTKKDAWATSVHLLRTRSSTRITSQQMTISTPTHSVRSRSIPTMALPCFLSKMAAATSVGGRPPPAKKQTATTPLVARYIRPRVAVLYAAEGHGPKLRRTPSIHVIR